MMDSFEWKVVIIDDEEDIRDVLTITLKDAGYQVASAGDGEEGILLCDDIDRTCNRVSSK